MAPATGDDATSQVSPTVLAQLTRSRQLGFLGPGGLAAQVEHAVGFAEVILREAVDHWLDMGAGGGLPGLVLCERLPGTSGVLLDAMEKRTAFLEEAVDMVGCADRVQVVRDRAEEWAHRPGREESLDVVVARGFGPPALTAECAARVLRIGGRLVVSEPPGSTGDRWSAVDGTTLGLVFEEVVDLPCGRFAVLRKRSSTPPALPRRGAALTKRPLF